MSINAEFLKKEAEMKALSIRKTSMIKYKFIVLSGKGGVGKSIVTANLGLAFSKLGFKGKIGILDADIHGPSIPRYLGYENAEVLTDGEKLYPVETKYGIKLMSASFFLKDKELPIIWRGPLKIKLIRDMITSTEWGNLDLLLIDTPPGTGDEIQGIVEYISKITGAVVVTIPSDVSLHVVKRAVTFLKTVNVPLKGIIENMSFVRCNDGSVKRPFGEGGAKVEKELGEKIIARIPMNPLLSNPIDDTNNPYEYDNLNNNEVAISFMEAAKKLIESQSGV
ncbi:P-loop NTPase [Fervidicoccus sp.]|uniref:P-loop NTPase n=1 Tax=Fervidicoccus sp. TaxID=2060324 RepID=UPI003D0AB1FC